MIREASAVEATDRPVRSRAARVSESVAPACTVAGTSPTALAAEMPPAATTTLAAPPPTAAPAIVAETERTAGSNTSKAMM